MLLAGKSPTRRHPLRFSIFCLATPNMVLELLFPSSS
jgi:hypothetical protein